MSNKPPKVVIPGLSRGGGVPAGYILGRPQGTGRGPVQLLNLAQLRRVGIRTAGGSSADPSQSTSLSQISSSLSGAISSTSSLSSAVSTSLSSNLSKITSLSTAVSTVDSNQNTSLSQVSSSLSGAISSTTSLSSALGTAATKNIGTVGATVPLLNGAAVTWAAGATFGGAITVSGSFGSSYFADLGSNPGFRIAPNAGVTFSSLRLAGDGDSIALGLDILAGGGGAYFSADSQVFRNAAQSTTYLTLGSSVNASALPFTVAGTLSTTGNISGADITATRGDGTGAVYFDGGTHYVYFNGTDYTFGGSGALIVGGGAVFSSAVFVPDDAYAAGWDGSAAVPTKNAVYDKIQTIQTAGGSLKLPVSTVAGLPSAATEGAGAVRAVSNALTPTLGVIVVGGGSVYTIVLSDGTNWIAN